MNKFLVWLKGLFGKKAVALPAPTPSEVVVPSPAPAQPPAPIQPNVPNLPMPVIITKAAPVPTPVTNRKMDLTEQNLWRLWRRAVPTVFGMREAIAIANHIIANMPIYDKISQDLGGLIPGYFIGCLHYREQTSLSLRAYLGNGELIIGTGRKTRIVPHNRGPFATFDQGAVDALTYQGFHRVRYWDLMVCLDMAERWNGLGYRMRGVVNPYLWASTSAYTRGKYTSDGHYDPNAVDQELGLSVILMALKQQGVDLKEIQPS